MSEKEEVIKMIQALPDNVSLEEILREIYIHTRFQRGVNELNEEKIENVIKMESDKWLQ
ncbi:hypothetical protein [Oceanobacillus chungangensis]|uniref:hypothetical protein n=1 Tax=Oceanobacillus chungangensis TaxID=1229152 RepID=UPI001475A510|nr:hypothetical protein [Oceanobacillus chungangensis]